MTIGTGVGGLGGAGVGYLSSDEDDRKRNMLVGGATGAALGGLAGGLTRGSQTHIPPEMAMRQHADMVYQRGFQEGVEQAADHASEQVTARAREAYDQGSQHILELVAKNPQGALHAVDSMTPEVRQTVAHKILESMEPEKRKLILSQFNDKHWFARMFER